tara:strand:+ start:31496 stop:32911 length:1416 start_codon:yes stop_codon:yes gene_type:complete
MKAILFTSNMAWNNDRTDNFGNASVKEISDLTEEEKETFYPCSLYYEVGARDDTGYETLKIENISVDGPDGSPIKVFNITTKGPDGVVRNLMHPDPRDIDTRAHDWATSRYGGADGNAIAFKIDDVKTYTKVNRKEVEKELNKMITDIRGEDDDADDDAASEFFPVGEGRITGAITGDSQFTPFGANAEEMASEFSVERINPTVVKGSEDVKAESFGAENIEAVDVTLMDGMAMPEGSGAVIGQATPETDFTPFSVSAETCAKCAETFAACGCEDKEADTFFQGAETFSAHVMPLGSGSVTGQATPDTDFTPFGARAEDFAAYADEISDRQIYRIQKLGGKVKKDMSRSEASDYIKELMGRESGTWRGSAEQVVPFGVVGGGNDFGQNLAENFDAEQVVPFGVVGGGNDFGQNLAEDFGAESKGMMNMIFGMGLALAAGIGAKMMIDRMDEKEEAPDSEEPSEESEEAPDE